MAWQMRRDTATNWTSEDPVLAQGEPGFDTTNNEIRIGNGTDTWSNLDPISGGNGGGGGGDVPSPHALGGTHHSSDTLANLNAKISDATLDDASDPRDPTAHNHAESDITDLGAYPDATGQLAGKVAETDGADGWTFIDTPSGGSGGDVPSPHSLGGSHHSADTLANINTKVSDADLASEAYVDDAVANGSGAGTETPEFTPTSSKIPGYLDNTWNNNATAFIQQNVWTEPDGTVYAVWVDHNRDPIIGKRAPDSDEWATFDLSSTAIGSPVAEEVHSVLTVVVDGDGIIHVAGNFYRASWRSVRSTTAGDITGWTSQGSSISGDETSSYPTFVRLADGGLLAAWRQGTSDSGRMRINTWDGSWGSPVTVVDGAPDDINAYWHRITVDVAGRIHLFIVWRVVNDADGNQDLAYLRSDDDGETWRQSDDTQYALPVRRADAELVVNTGASSGILNQGGADADASGHPHCAIFQHDANDHTQVVHVWHDGTAWNTEDVTSFTDKITLGGNFYNVVLSRPAVICPANGGTLLVYRTDWEDDNAWLSGIDVTVPGNPRPFRLLRHELGQYEPTIDEGARRFHDRLSMLVTANQLENGTAEYGRKVGHVLSWPASLLTVEATVEAPPTLVPTEPPAPTGSWLFDETSGTTAADETGNHNGVYVNSPTLGEPGVDGTAVLFNGTNQYMTADSIASVFATTAWTMELLLKTTTTSPVVPMCAGKSSDSNRPSAFIQLNADLSGVNTSAWRVSIRTSNTNNFLIAATGSSAFRDGDFHLLHVTREGNNIKLYFDGVEVASGTTGIVPSGLNQFTVAANRRDNIDNYLPGTVDWPRVFGQTLLAGEISDRYDALFGP